MIKVIEEKPVPRDTIECSNCHSILEYGNSDLSIDWEREREQMAMYASLNHWHYFNCPVCGCKVCASWIINK